MHTRVVDALRSSLGGLLLIGCVPGEIVDDDEAGETTGTSGTSDESSTSEDPDDETESGDDGALPACGESGESQPGPPRLLAAELATGSVVRLTFTEAIASVEGIDPASFRISWSFYDDFGSYGGITEYDDPMALLCSISDHCTGVYTEVVELGCAGTDPNTLLLRLEGFQQSYVCAVIAESPDDALLFPHFDASIGPVTDLDGEALASIAADFVQAPGEWMEVEGNFPNYPMRIPIECP